MEPNRQKTAGTSRAILANSTVERRRSSRITNRRKSVYCADSSSDDDTLTLPMPVRSSSNYKNLGKDKVKKLTKRAQHICDTSEVLSGEETRSVLGCKNKHKDRSENKYPKSVKSHTGNVTLNSKALDKKVKRTLLTCPTKCKPSTARKMNVSYTLSDISDDETQSNGTNIPMFSTYNKFKSDVGTNSRSTLNTMSMPGPSGVNSRPPESSFLVCDGHIADEIDSYISEILESAVPEGSKPFKNTQDFIDETERLLSMTNDLIEIDNSPTTDESVVFVGKRLLSKVEKNERFKNKEPDEIIDLCSSANPPKELAPESTKNRGSRNIGECPICFEALNNLEVAATICGHVFCKPCIHNAIESCKKCPNCRKRLTLKQIHPLFI